MKNKHILIIGGTRGIGYAVANAFASRGHTVSVIGRTSKIQTNSNQQNIRYFFVDLFQEKNLKTSIENIITRSGKLSHLVFCQRFRDAEKDWQGELAISLTATKQIIELVCNQFDNTPEKSIVIINSVANSLIGLEQPLSYHVAKAGLSQLVRYFAVVFGSKGIRVNSISPSTVLKEGSKQFYLRNKKLQNLYKKIIPLGRMGKAEEISDAVDFLCSTKSSFITGQNIIVDGGLSLRSQEDLARELTSLTHYGK